MTDIAKRNTLKAVAATAISLAAAPSANAITPLDVSAGTAKTTGPQLPSIQSQLSNNTLEVVISNHDLHPTVITDISPPRIHLEQGDFDLQALVKNGPITLAPGQHVRVALSSPTRLRNTALRHSVASLNDVLKNNVSFAL